MLEAYTTLSKRENRKPVYRNEERAGREKESRKGWKEKIGVRVLCTISRQGNGGKVIKGMALCMRQLSCICARKASVFVLS